MDMCHYERAGELRSTGEGGIGTGAQGAVKKGGQNMVAHLANSAKSASKSTVRTRRYTRRGAQIISKDEAVAILASALNYCDNTGIVVQIQSGDGRLVVTLEGVTVEDGELRHTEGAKL